MEDIIKALPGVVDVMVADFLRAHVTAVIVLSACCLVMALAGWAFRRRGRLDMKRDAQRCHSGEADWEDYWGWWVAAGLSWIAAFSLFVGAIDAVIAISAPHYYALRGLLVKGG